MALPKDPMKYVFPMMHDLYEVAHEDVNKLDPNALVERLKGIHKGLSAEHEFAAIASWLGSTRLIVSADDVLDTDGQFRVPDFLVVVQKGDRDVPFLVQVKSDLDDKLVWSEKYLAAMKRFPAALLVVRIETSRRIGRFDFPTRLSHCQNTRHLVERRLDHPSDGG